MVAGVSAMSEWWQLLMFDSVLVLLLLPHAVHAYLFGMPMLTRKIFAPWNLWHIVQHSLYCRLQ